METIENEKHNMHINPCIGVIIEDDRYGYQYPASLYECDNGEMYLETNFAPNPGSTFSMFFDNLTIGAVPHACHAIILWRKLLCESNSPWSYGLGIKYI